MEPLHVSGHDSQEAKLIDDILQCPELGYEEKGTRMRAIFLCLWDLYRSAPHATSSERFIADAVYNGMGDEEDSIVRRAVTRLRRFLDRIAKERLSKHSIRVRIPLRKYKLEFYHPFLVNGLRPVEWFWSSYFDSSVPAALVLFPPKRAGLSIPDEFSHALSERLKVAFGREVQQFDLPDFPRPNQYRDGLVHYRPFSSLEVRFVVAEEHGMMLGSYPADLDPEYECEVLRRKALTVLGHQESPLVNGLSAISYAKLTRFTNPNLPRQQITLLDAEWDFPVERLVEDLTLDEYLQPLMARPDFTSDGTARVPRKFQMLFSAVHLRAGGNAATQNVCTGPVLRAVTLGPKYVYAGTPGYPWKYVETRAL